jgi:hypothetical protein
MKVKKIHATIYGETFNLLSKPNYTKTFFGDNKEINSLNFRSDEFTNKHNGLHILFSGCSITQGVGLLEEEIWAKKLYNKISKNEKCSGYFNLAISATGLCDQVINIFKYFNIYGDPNFIFLNIPNPHRFYFYDKNFEKIRNAFFEKEDEKFIEFIYEQYYMMLEIYCKKNNIKLISFSYRDNLQNNFFKNFKTFYKINTKEKQDFIFNYIQKNKKNKYAEIARDGDHPGEAYHEYWSNFIYEIYKKNKNKN